MIRQVEPWRLACRSAAGHDAARYRDCCALIAGLSGILFYGAKRPGPFLRGALWALDFARCVILLLVWPSPFHRYSHRTRRGQWAVRGRRWLWDRVWTEGSGRGLKAFPAEGQAIENTENRRRVTEGHGGLARFGRPGSV